MSRFGRALFAAAIMALGVETVVCFRSATQALGAGSHVIPVIPWFPSIAILALLGGVAWIALGAGLLYPRVRRMSAIWLGSLLCGCAFVLVAPPYFMKPGDMGLRTGVFETLSLAALAWMCAGEKAGVFYTIGRYFLSVSLIVFGVDHLLALQSIGTLVPSWIPWHVFWIGFFGVALIAAGMAIALKFMERQAALGLGLMFAIWVVTLHLPRVMGLYGIPGATRNPDEWSSLLIAVAMCGGSLALARPTSL